MGGNHKKYLVILYVGIFLALLPLFFRKYSESGSNYENRINRYFAGLIPDTVFFCNQPLQHVSWNVKKIIEEEFLRHVEKNKVWQLQYQRCKFWEKYIRGILRELSLPEDLFYVCVAESKCSNVFSPKGAGGFWQLVPFTAQNFGLRVDSCVDERLHPLKATRAAGKYFLFLHKELNDWPRVVMAYNTGLDKMLRLMKMQGTGRVDSIRTVRESRNFLYRVISLKYLFEQPERFNVKWNYKQWSDFNVITGKNIRKKQKKNMNISNKEIMAMNPWIFCESELLSDKNEIFLFPAKNISPSYYFGVFSNSSSELNTEDTLIKTADSL